MSTATRSELERSLGHCRAGIAKCEAALALCRQIPAHQADVAGLQRLLAAFRQHETAVALALASTPPVRN